MSGPTQLPGASTWASNMRTWVEQNRTVNPDYAGSSGVRDAITAQAKVVGVDPGAILDAPSSPGSSSGTSGGGTGGGGTGSGGAGNPPGSKTNNAPSGVSGPGGGPNTGNKPGTTPPAPSKEGYGDFSGTAPNGRPSADESADFAKRLANHLKKKYGLTDEQVAGIFANLMIESRFKVNIREGGGQWGGDLSITGGNGLAQWTGMAQNGPSKERGLLFKEFCEANGLDPNSELANVMFLDHELQGTHSHVIDAIKKAGSAQESMMIFGKQFENPSQPHWEVRSTFIDASLELITGRGDENFKRLTENI
ncbi:phage tail tip lysozyme [Noviherbaspirillum aridicola]|uniref:Phage tail lysozyme domain-containing protein n=1 Tax=Noviherbaspirillum aridicola TaxID=2849687 RepID=A0ABQ4Q4Y9_9BURK|nr:phage tail tip lysozyme [Noviherbaspirillum aridicola]GIZ52127.1 hypothetical protein NCCP691_21410 [Noviherbaspirillum aridicola]